MDQDFGRNRKTAEKGVIVFFLDQYVCRIQKSWRFVNSGGAYGSVGYLRSSRESISLFFIFYVT